MLKVKEELGWKKIFQNLNEDLTQQFSLPVYSYNLLLEIHKFFENRDMLRIRLIKVTLESQSPTWKQKAGLNK